MRLPEYKAWKTFEDALLGLSSRSRNTLEVVMIFPLTGNTLELAYRATFLLRFREVGKVILQSPRMFPRGRQRILL